MWENIWLLMHSLPNLVVPIKKKERAFDQNIVVQSLFVDKKLYNI